MQDPDTGRVQDREELGGDPLNEAELRRVVLQQFSGAQDIRVSVAKDIRTATTFVAIRWSPFKHLSPIVVTYQVDQDSLRFSDRNRLVGDAMQAFYRYFVPTPKLSWYKRMWRRLRR